MFVYKITEMTVMGGGSIKGEGRIQDMGGVPAEPRREMRRSVGVGRKGSVRLETNACHIHHSHHPASTFLLYRSSQQTMS